METFRWYVPLYTPNLSQRLMFELVVSGAGAELSYIKRSSYTKDVTTENDWTFQLGLQSGIDVPIYVFVGFMQRG